MTHACAARFFLRQNAVKRWESQKSYARHLPFALAVANVPYMTNTTNTTNISTTVVSFFADGSGACGLVSIDGHKFSASFTNETKLHLISSGKPNRRQIALATAAWEKEVEQRAAEIPGWFDMCAAMYAV